MIDGGLDHQTAATSPFLAAVSFWRTRLARPTSFTTTTANAILDAKSAGRTHVEAAAAAGIAPRTLRSWIERGDRGEEPFATFVTAFRQAEHTARRAAVDAAVADLRAMHPAA